MANSVLPRATRVSDEQQQRIRTGMRLQIEDGWCAGPAPLGYINRKDQYGSYVEIDWSIAPLVQQSFHLLTIPKLSLRAVHREMTRRGLVSKKGRPLSFSAFQLMVTNPFYTGYLRYQGELHRGKHKALVSNTLFNMVRERVEVPRQQKNYSPQPVLDSM
jgi:hypothetical protein